MVRVETYATPCCPYCVRARQLLADKGAEVEEFDVSMKPALRAKMMERSNRWTVPQIFIDGIHVGGSDDLILAARSGELDWLPNGAGSTGIESGTLGHKRWSFVLRRCDDGQVAVEIDLYVEANRPAAHLAILDVLLLGNGIIDKRADRFTAVRTAQCSLGQFRHAVVTQIRFVLTQRSDNL